MADPTLRNSVSGRVEEEQNPNQSPGRLWLVEASI